MGKSGEILWSPNLTSRFYKMQINCSLAKQHLAFQEGLCSKYRGAEKSLGRPGRKQAWKHVRDARDFNNMEIELSSSFFFPARQGTEGNSRAILTETLAFFLPGRAKDLSAPL